MKIIIMDKNTTTSNDDISFQMFDRLGEVIICNNLNIELDILNYTKDVDVIVLNKVILNRPIIEKLSSSIKLIAITATGYDNVDVAAATERGIKVVNVPGYGTNAVAQLALQLILACAIQLIPQMNYMKQNGWDKQAGLSITMHELSGKTLGILGLGAIGERIATLALAFDMKVIAYNRTHKSIKGIEMVDLNTLAKESDYLSLSCVLNDDTRKIIDSKFLSLMKSSAYIVNTARGGLIDEDALIIALQNGMIAGAALDVLTFEPPLADNPLLNMTNVILTPHIGWAPLEARQRCIDITYSNIDSFVNGKPQNLLN